MKLLLKDFKKFIRIFVAAYVYNLIDIHFRICQKL